MLFFPSCQPGKMSPRIPLVAGREFLYFYAASLPAAMAGRADRPGWIQGARQAFHRVFSPLPNGLNPHQFNTKRRCILPPVLPESGADDWTE